MLGSSCRAIEEQKDAVGQAANRWPGGVFSEEYVVLMNTETIPSYVYSVSMAPNP